MSRQQSPTAAPQLRPGRAAFAAFVGTTIEWYDFYIYGTAAALVFGKVFFSSTMDPGVATLLAFVTFWAGFAARPLGGIVFGHLGDRVGRKTALVITLVMMGLATTGIGLLPGYAQIGVWAPAGLVVLRVLQGIAVGGEWGGAVLIASENAPKHRSILYAAFAQQETAHRQPAGHGRVLRAERAAHPVVPDVGLAHSVPAVGRARDHRHGDPAEARGVGRHAARARAQAHREAAAARVVRDHWVVVLLAAGTLPVINVTYFRSTFALSWATKGSVTRRARSSASCRSRSSCSS